MKSVRKTQPSSSALEIVRCIYDALEDGDTRTLLKYFRNDVEAYVSDFLPWGGRMKGLKAFADGFLTMGQYARISFEPMELIDSGSHVVAVGRTGGIMHETGQIVSVKTVHVWRIEDEKVAAVSYYHERDFQQYFKAAAA